MVVSLAVKDYKEMFNKAIRNEKYSVNDSNSAKNIRCYDAVLKCLDAIAPETVFTVETAKGKANRPFDLPNIGSLMECVVKYACDKEPCEKYAKEFADDKADTKIGWCDYEIKACMGAVSLNTKITGERPILFINTKGVFSIKKDEIATYVKNGKLPYNKEIGKPWANLMRKLGF